MKLSTDALALISTDRLSNVDSDTLAQALTDASKLAVIREESRVSTATLADALHPYNLLDALSLGFHEGCDWAKNAHRTSPGMFSLDCLERITAGLIADHDSKPQDDAWKHSNYSKGWRDGVACGTDMVRRRVIR